MKHTAAVSFTRSGWRQYLQMNRGLGSRFVKGFILRHELSAYLAAHEEHGAHMDTTCQEIHYGDGIYLLLMKSQGIWYITDIWADAEPAGFTPIFLWQQVKRGWQTFVGKALIGWRHIAQGISLGKTLS